MKLIREMNVGELRELLFDYPDHTPVAPFFNGTVGVMLSVILREVDGAPTILIGEPSDLKMPPTVPDEWLEATR